LRINYKIKSLGTKISDAFGKLINPDAWWNDKDSLSDAMKKITANDDSDHLEKQFPDGCPKIRLNCLKRVDYILQENPFEEANEYISGLTGHTSYFDLADVARFIISHIVMQSPQDEQADKDIATNSDAVTQSSICGGEESRK
jgi:hypothetical protein